MKKIIGILSILVIICCLGFLGYQKVTDFMVRKTLTLISEDESIQKHLDTVLEGMKLPDDLQKEPPESQADTPEASDKGKKSEPQKEGTKENTPSAKKEPTKTQTPSQGGLTMDSLDSADKAYVMNIYKRFTSSEISTVSGMLSGGITKEEKKQIKAIVYAKVSGAEVKELYRIADKYR